MYISWWYSLIVISFMYEWFHIIRVHDMNWGNLIMCVWVQLSCWDLLRIILIDNFLSELHHNNIIKFFWLSHVHHLLKIQYVVPNCVSYNCFTLIMLGIIIWIKDIETKEKRPQFNWSDEMEYAFIQAMITQQNKGNRPGGNFSSEAYTNMVNELRQNLKKRFYQSSFKKSIENYKRAFFWMLWYISRN